MLKLLTCPHGHFWEAEQSDEAPPRAAVCPECGAAADTLPLLDLAPSDGVIPAAELPPEPPPLRDERGRPVVAGYDVLEELGKGPTGVHVYRARQVPVNRTVLLKVVWAKDDPGQVAWGSLRGEASALGRLQHPYVVQVFDAGERDRQLFYNAVELVEGPTLAEKLAERMLPTRQVLALMEALARAVHHAHERGVVHRSLKPASVLLLPREKAERQRKADAPPLPPFLAVHAGQYLPKITDYGLARRPVEGEVNDLELQGDTPGYLAPEQAWGRAKEIGPATDIYGLGAILYHMLTGRPPFRGRDVNETIEAIQCKELVPPSQVRSGVSYDLSAICRKCLAKQPRRRYGSALELAEDLRRVAEGHTARVRTASAAERFGKWLRRRRTTAAVLFLLFVCFVSTLTAYLVGGAGGGDRDGPRNRSDAQFYRSRNDELAREVKRLRQQLAQDKYFGLIAQAQKAVADDQFVQARTLLNQCPPDQRHWEWRYLFQRANLAGPLKLGPFAEAVTAVAYSPDGTYLAAAGAPAADRPGGPAGAEVKVWQVPRWERARLHDFTGTVYDLAFSPDGQTLAAACGARGDTAGEVRAYSSFGGQRLWSKSFPQRITGLAYAPDGASLFAAQADGTAAKLWATGAPQGTTFGLPQRGKVCRVAVSPDGNVVALGSQTGLELYDAAFPRLFSRPGRVALDLAFSEDGRLALASDNGAVRVWDTSMNRELLVLRGGARAVRRIAFSRDGQRLAAVEQDGTVRVWAPDANREVLAVPDAATGAGGIAFSPDGLSLAIASGKHVHVWGAGAP